MKRMSNGQIILRTALSMVLFFALLHVMIRFAKSHPQVTAWVQKTAALLPSSIRVFLPVLLLSLVAIALFVLFFFLSGKLISIALQIAGKDPVKQYRIYSQSCREQMGDIDNCLQLEQPTFLSARIKRVCIRTAVFLACLLAFIWVAAHMFSTTGRALLSIFLGLLAAMGVLLVYFLLWMIITAFGGKTARIHKIRK